MKEYQRRNDEKHMKTNNISNEITFFLQTSSQLTCLKLLGSKFVDPKNESAVAGTNLLVKDRSRKSGSIPERSWTKLAPVHVNVLQWKTKQTN